MSATDHVEGEFLKLLFGRVTASPPPIFYFGLSSTAISDTGTGATEPSGGSYSNPAIANNTTNFVYSGGQVTNGTAIVFPIATAAWGNVNYWFAADLPLSSGGTVQVRGSINPAQSIAIGERLYFDTGGLAITMD